MGRSLRPGAPLALSRDDVCSTARKVSVPQNPSQENMIATVCPVLTSQGLLVPLCLRYQIDNGTITAVDGTCVCDRTELEVTLSSVLLSSTAVPVSDCRSVPAADASRLPPAGAAAAGAGGASDGAPGGAGRPAGGPPGPASGGPGYGRRRGRQRRPAPGQRCSCGAPPGARCRECHLGSRCTPLLAGLPSCLPLGLQHNSGTW